MQSFIPLTRLNQIVAVSERPHLLFVKISCPSFWNFMSMNYYKEPKLKHRFLSCTLNENIFRTRGSWRKFEQNSSRHLSSHHFKPPVIFMNMKPRVLSGNTCALVSVCSASIHDLNFLQQSRYITFKIFYTKWMALFWTFLYYKWLNLRIWYLWLSVCWVTCYLD